MPVDHFQASLLAALGESVVITDTEDMHAFESDWRNIHKHPARAVALPRTTAEVQTIVRLCAEHGVPIVAQGGNTSLVAGAVPTPGRREVVVNLRRMNRIREVDALNNSLVAEAGCVLNAVREAADSAGRMFPLSLAAEGSCQIGGNVATNAGGVQVLSYGSMRELVLGLEVVMADGEVWSGLRTLRKDNTGLDIKQLFIGSEGTLGIITAAALHLVPKPVQTQTVLVAVAGSGPALQLFQSLQNRFGSDLTSFEYFEPLALSLAMAHSSTLRMPFASSHAAYVLLEITTLDPDVDLNAAAEVLLAGAIEAGDVEDAVFASSGAQRSNLWALRESLSEGERLAGGAVKHDVSVPIPAIPETISGIRQALASVFPEARLNVFGHFGDGNLHINVLPPPGQGLDLLMREATRLTDAIYDVVIAKRGSFSAEHGIGQMRKADLRRRRTALDISLMASVKKALDPHALFNPGKVFDC